MQLLVTLGGINGTYTLDVPAGSTGSACVLALIAAARARTYETRTRSKAGSQIFMAAATIPLLLTCGGRPLADNEAVWPTADALPLLIRATPRGALLGGKGGFGANLRAQGRSSGAKGSVNFGSCRDLNGRRLSTVNNEARLKAWLSPEETAKRASAVKARGEVTEAAGPTGQPGWMLAAPSWAEGGGGAPNQSVCVKYPSAATGLPHVKRQDQATARHPTMRPAHGDVRGVLDATLRMAMRSCAQRVTRALRWWEWNARRLRRR